MPESQQSLKQIWQSMSPGERDSVAAQAETTPAYLRQVLACGRRCSPVLAKEIEVAMDGRITRQMLRPDVFADLVHAA